MSTQESGGAPDQNTAAKVEPATGTERNSPAGNPGTATPAHPSVDLAAVHAYTAPFLAGMRNIPALGSPDWCALDDEDPRKLAALAVAGLSRLTLPQDIAGELQRTAEGQADKDEAVAISTGLDWSAVAARPSHAELERRRAQPGPLAHTVDPVAVRRWVATGHSGDEGRAAA